MSVSDIQMRREDGTFQSIFPITVEQGGTGADNTNNALDNLGVKDYVVAEGTSENWYYRKYESGVAECWMLLRRQLPIVSGKFQDQEEISYPFPFIENPILTTSIPAYNCLIYTTNNSTKLGWGWRGLTTETRNINFQIRAIGRYK